MEAPAKPGLGDCEFPSAESSALEDPALVFEQPALKEKQTSETTLIAPKRRLLYLIRHAQALHNVTAAGADTLDPSLTETGIEQSVVLRSIFEELDPNNESEIKMHLVLTRDGRETTFTVPKPKKILTSPFRRTMQTASLLFGSRSSSTSSSDPVKIKVEPLVQESGTLNCDTGSTLSTLIREFGVPQTGNETIGTSVEESAAISLTDNDSDSSLPMRKSKRLKPSERLFQKYAPNLPHFEFDGIEEEWNLRKRRDGDDPFKRGWEFKEKIWEMFEELEEQEGENGDGDGEWVGPIAVVSHGGFLKSLLVWDQGSLFHPFANAEIRAFEVKQSEISADAVRELPVTTTPKKKKSRGKKGTGGPQDIEFSDGGSGSVENSGEESDSDGKEEEKYVVVELHQLSMEELAFGS